MYVIVLNEMNGLYYLNHFDNVGFKTDYIGQPGNSKQECFELNKNDFDIDLRY